MVLIANSNPLIVIVDGYFHSWKSYVKLFLVVSADDYDTDPMC